MTSIVVCFVLLCWDLPNQRASWFALGIFRMLKVYITNFRAEVWKILTFWVDFVAGNSNKLQKLGLEGKISWALNVFTLSNLEIFNSENVKMKNAFTLGPNGTNYTVVQIMKVKKIWNAFSCHRQLWQFLANFFSKRRICDKIFCFKNIFDCLFLRNEFFHLYQKLIKW